MNRRVLVLPLAVLLGIAGAPVAAQTTTTDTSPPLVELEFVPPEVWAPSPPGATARAFVLVDADTGQVLAEREADVPLPVASTVKLLTVLTALSDDVVDPLDFDDVVTVGDEVRVGEAGVGLVPGDRWSVRDLVEGVMVRSGNDAALALASAAGGGSIEAFVERMNAVAAGLGIEGATIREPTGLADTNRLTARHLAVLGRAALDVPELAAIADLEVVDLPGLGAVETRNLLLMERDEVNGLKTGFTTISGWCLVASMTTDDGRELVAVVLGANEDADRFDESLALLDLGDDELAPFPFLAGARVRLPGAWIGEQGEVTVSVPVGDTPVVEVAVDDRAVVATVLTGDGTAIARTTTALPADDTVGGTGARLTGRLYEVMRAAHAAELWEASATTSGGS